MLRRGCCGCPGAGAELQPPASVSPPRPAAQSQHRFGGTSKPSAGPPARISGCPALREARSVLGMCGASPALPPGTAWSGGSGGRQTPPLSGSSLRAFWGRNLNTRGASVVCRAWGVPLCMRGIFTVQVGLRGSGTGLGNTGEEQESTHRGSSSKLKQTPKYPPAGCLRPARAAGGHRAAPAGGELRRKRRRDSHPLLSQTFPQSRAADERRRGRRGRAARCCRFWGEQGAHPGGQAGRHPSPVGVLVVLGGALGMLGCRQPPQPPGDAAALPAAGDGDVGIWGWGWR